MDRERLLELAQQAEQRQKSSFEASKEFIHKYASLNHKRAKELIATGMDQKSAFQQASKENSNLTLDTKDTLC